MAAARYLDGGALEHEPEPGTSIAGTSVFNMAISIVSGKYLASADTLGGMVGQMTLHDEITAVTPVPVHIPCVAGLAYLFDALPLEAAFAASPFFSLSLTDSIQIKYHYDFI